MRQIIRLLLAESSQKNDVENPLTFTAEQANSTVKLTKSGSPTVSGLKYRQSIRGVWKSYTINTVITLANVGDIVQFKNTEQTLSSSNSNYVYFVMTGIISASGNIQSMLNYIEQCKRYCYYRLFYNCSKLTVAPDLTATTLADYCYYYMFYNCKGLTIAPELNATTLARYCYSNMFYDCSKLTNAPILPSTTLADYCYYYMFSGCSSLTIAPELPATTLANYCYSYMFDGCSSLTTAPELPATTLANHCYYYMFYNCKGLTEAPELPATTLTTYCYHSMFCACKSLTVAPELTATILADYCYSNMFYDCSNLTVAPELSVTTLKIYCYNQMFYNCKSLTTAPELPATTLKTYCYHSMFSGCSSLVTAPELPATTLADSCYNQMFYNCKSLTTAPELPATTLADSCYYNMFYGCSSLVTAPELPATTLAKWCYYNMFNGCSKLNYIKVGFTTWLNTATSNWVTGVASSGTFEAPRELPVIFGTSNMPENWDLPNHEYIILTENQKISQNYQEAVDYAIQYVLLPETLQPTFTIVQGGLPNGLTLDSSTGVISGNLTEEFFGDIQIQISCEGCESAIMTLSLTLHNYKETENNLTADDSNPNYTVSQRTTSSSYYAWKAMDGNTSTYSKTQYASGQYDWWQIDFHKPVFLIGFTLNCNNQGSYGTYLEASSDGASWTKIDSTKIPDDTTTTREYEFTTPYQYYRFINERAYYYIQFYQVKFKYKE